MKKITIIDLGTIMLASYFLCCACNNVTALTNRTSTKKYPNPLIGTSWIITNNKIIGLNQNDSLFLLTKKNNTISIWNYYAITFTDSIHFMSYDSWECGNDCFTRTFGHYTFVNAYKINFYTDSITRHGTCNEPTVYTDTLPGQMFNIALDKHTLKMIK